MNTRVLNSLGLFLGIIGVVIIFIWGPPQPAFSTWTLIGEPLPDNEAKQVLAERGRYRVLSAAGLGLVGIGFIFQLAAVWVPTGVQAHAHKRE